MRDEPDDPRVIAAVEQYQTAVEAGQRLDLQAFLQRHPDIAGPLGECLAGLRLVHAAAPALHGVSLVPAADRPKGGILR